MNIPIEIRQHIYRLLTPADHLTIIKTCHRVYDEAQPLLVRHRPFPLKTDLYDLASLPPISIQETLTLASIRSIKVSIDLGKEDIPHESDGPFPLPPEGIALNNILFELVNSNAHQPTSSWRSLQFVRAWESFTPKIGCIGFRGPRRAVLWLAEDLL